jgi:glycosyltransferase involved in cell wall biosynthesis
MTSNRIKVTFLLSKDPVTEHGGDIELSRLVMRLAAETFDVSAICLSSETPGAVTADVIDGGLPLTRVYQAAVKPPQLLIGAVKTKRSLVHVRFDTDELLSAIEESDADVFVAEHNYMADTFLRSKWFGVKGFAINTVNTESQVWLATRGLLGRIEAPRLRRDEVRTARAADAVGCYEIEESEMYRRNGVSVARWMDVTLPPIKQIDVASTSRRLVFMGGRDWPPNQEAFLHTLKLWPRIADGIPDAELVVIGAKKSGAKDPVYPAGVRDLGFVDDLAAFLGTCRALVAPIKTGGGVRVKLLDSIRMGLPVVGTTAAVGSLKEPFNFSVYDDDASFVAACRRFLLDVDAAVTAGNELYRLNTEHWERRHPQKAVESLLRAGIRQ